MRHGVQILGVLALAMCCTACQGYSTQRLSAFPRARTVAVVPFKNQTYRRDLGLRLTQAVVNEIRGRTEYAIGAPDTADLLVEGEFDANVTVQGLDLNRVPIVQRLEGTLNVRIVERVSRKVVAKDIYWAQAEFLPSAQGDTLDARGTDEWTRRMAVRVVQLLERPL